MAYFDEQDWQDLRQILKKDYWEFLRRKWFALGQSVERMKAYLEWERKAFKTAQLLKGKKTKKR